MSGSDRFIMVTIIITCVKLIVLKRYSSRLLDDIYQTVAVLYIEAGISYKSVSYFKYIR